MNEASPQPSESDTSFHAADDTAELRTSPDFEANDNSIERTEKISTIDFVNFVDQRAEKSLANTRGKQISAAAMTEVLEMISDYSDSQQALLKLMAMTQFVSKYGDKLAPGLKSNFMAEIDKSLNT